jgi:hypothetical protein
VSAISASAANVVAGLVAITAILATTSADAASAEVRRLLSNAKDRQGPIDVKAENR